MVMLLLDTSTEKGIVACIRDQQILFSSELPFGLQNSHYLLPELVAQLKNSGLRIEDLSHIAVGVGPGSYTGIRVAATVAKTISFASKIPLVPINTLQIFAPTKVGKFAAVIDAKIGGIYVQLGEVKSQVISYLKEAQVLSLKEATELLSEVPLLITPVATSLKTKLTEKNWDWEEAYPSVMHMHSLALKKILANEMINDYHLDLLYMRKTQAEIERDNLNLLKQ